MPVPTSVDNEGPELSPEKLIAKLELLGGLRCRMCEGAICFHEALMAIVTGFSDPPCCSSCLASALGRETGEMRDRIFGIIEHRDCFRAAWDWATRREGFEGPDRPRCLWPKGGGAVASGARPPAPEPGVSLLVPDDAWDAGDLACGDLVLELRMRLRRMAAAQVLKLTARDPGAPEDLPAWCGLTGHTLLFSSHPIYFIQRKED